MEGNKDEKAERWQDRQGGGARSTTSDLQKVGIRLDSVRTPKIKIFVVSTDPKGKCEERTLH